jgi:hypothetical protein
MAVATASAARHATSPAVMRDSAPPAVVAFPIAEPGYQIAEPGYFSGIVSSVSGWAMPGG